MAVALGVGEGRTGVWIVAGRVRFVQSGSLIEAVEKL